MKYDFDLGLTKMGYHAIMCMVGGRLAQLVRALA